ncbi:Apolipoprotein N-acyltransferase [Thermodesulfobium acidiphilum]|uniref:Apolipoprotein N-acyltransferase n=1 Tax=Thermodesulfobium acidiphilum TaxID=1794699 RepID=A0A2R4W1G7_THEAF|nr:apolipoprotein N-acyltransferase [Thermodesulfobium acidiphilum]AWB10546.1 Apolipoprotein N-acyltransferase [Thermodesulfobium acidiphilum]
MTKKNYTLWLLTLLLTVFTAITLYYFDNNILIFFFLSPLFYIIRNLELNKKNSFLIYFNIFLYFLTNTSWLSIFGIHIVILMSLYLSLFWFLPIIIWKKIEKNIPKKLYTISLPIFLTSSEILRNSGPFAFGLETPGYFLIYTPFMYIASFIGVIGLTFLIFYINMLFSKKKTIPKALYLLCFLILAGSVVNFLNSNNNNIKYQEFTILQGNFRPIFLYDENYENLINKQYIDLFNLAQHQYPNSLIVTPEVIFRTCLNKENTLIPNQPSLIGSIYCKNDSYYNSIYFLNKNEKELVYEKEHLVPFGEFNPIPKIFGFLNRFFPQLGDFKEGKNSKTFKYKGLYIGFLICFEDTLPDLIYEKLKNNKINLLVVASNDGWFKDTKEPIEHLNISIFRAIEFGIPIIRAANTGPSAFINPNGDIMKLLPADRAGILFYNFKINKYETLYSKISTKEEKLFLTISLLILALSFFNIFRKFF